MNHASLSSSNSADSQPSHDVDALAIRVTVDARGRWLERTGEARVAVARRPVLSRILAALASAHEKGLAVSQGELVAAGWPDERIRPAAAKNRLHVALTRLRDLGLRGVLEQGDDGYRLASAVAVSDERAI